jgi:tetratricopeptide (TPR) repeat protein
MNPDAVPDTAPDPLAEARRAFEAGRLDQALAILRPLPREDLAVTDIAVAERLHALAAFRIGEFDEAAGRAPALRERVNPGVEGALEARFDVLSVAVVATGELARYEECLERVREQLTLAGRMGGLVPWVRARGSVASAFNFLGDVWAAQRILATLAGSLGPNIEPRLESTVRNNHASVCLLMARMADEGGDPAARDEALMDAAASVQRGAEIARQLDDPRLVSYSRLHVLELAMLCGEAQPSADIDLAAAIAEAEAAMFRAHWRQLKLLDAEMHLAAGDARGALDRLQPVLERLGDAHALSSRIKLHVLRHRALRAVGEYAQADASHAEADRLQAYRLYRQARAQSALVRTRLELEHLFTHRPGGTPRA